MSRDIDREKRRQEVLALRGHQAAEVLKTMVPVAVHLASQEAANLAHGAIDSIIVHQAIQLTQGVGHHVGISRHTANDLGTQLGHYVSGEIADRVGDEFGDMSKSILNTAANKLDRLGGQSSHRRKSW